MSRSGLYDIPRLVSPPEGYRCDEEKCLFCQDGEINGPVTDCQQWRFLVDSDDEVEWLYAILLEATNERQKEQRK